jgi:hypothetical protein
LPEYFLCYLTFVVFDDNFDAITQSYNLLPMLSEFSNYLKKVWIRFARRFFPFYPNLLENFDDRKSRKSSDFGQIDWSARKYSRVFEIQEVPQVNKHEQFCLRVVFQF